MLITNYPTESWIGIREIRKLRSFRWHTGLLFSEKSQVPTGTPVPLLESGAESAELQQAVEGAQRWNVFEPTLLKKGQDISPATNGFLD